MTKNFICPICGYPDLEVAPLNYLEKGVRYYSYSKGAPTYEICPCCGIEFGYGDYEKSWEELRKEWKENGASWHSTVTKKPKNWDPLKQLENLKKIPKEDYNAGKVKIQDTLK